MKTLDGYTEKYQAAFHCTSCDQELSQTEIRRSFGVCPYCGYVSEEDRCETVKKSKRVLGPGMLQPAHDVDVHEIAQDMCNRCDEKAAVIYGLCSECHDEFEEKMEKDD